MRAGWSVCVVAWVCRFVADFEACAYELEGACAKSLAGDVYDVVCGAVI